MNKMSESGFRRFKDKQDLKGTMKKKNINTYYSGNKHPENHLIRQILIQTMSGQPQETRSKPYYMSNIVSEDPED
jgi:hypothetical protein